MKRVYVLFVSSVLLAFSGSAGEAAKVESRNGCVNLRSQPSINAGVIRCLPPGTNLEPYRSPGSGRFTWQKEGDRVWYYTSVPGTSEKGWIMPVCTDIIGVNKGACTDTGAATPLANPQQPQIVAQAGQQEEFLKNPSWKVVPGAAVGKNSADTFMNLNGLNRNGNTVTFDIIGYQGSYNRLEGNCGDRQVRFLRRGIYRGLRSGISEKGALDLYVNYRSVTGEEASGTGEFHRKILDFACKQSQSQIANSLTGRSVQAVETVNGVIEGKVSYPSDYLPAMTVCAQSTSNFQSMSCIRTQEQQRTFKLTVKPGEYFIFSYAKNSFTDGNTGKKHDAFFYYAKNNTPISVRVSSGTLTGDITPRDQRVCHYDIPTAAYCTVPQSESIALTPEAPTTKPSQAKSSAKKIAEGVYWVGATGMGLRVRGGQYQRYEEGGESPWKPISELTAIKDGVVKAGDDYWCLSTLPQPKNSRSSVCSANGWTASPSVASKPTTSPSSNPSTSKPTLVSSPVQIISPPQKPSIESSAPVPAPSPKPTTPQSKPPSGKPLSPPSSGARVVDSQPATVPATWSGGAAGQGPQTFPDASSACRSFTSDPTLYVTLKLTENQTVYAAECHTQGGVEMTFVHCSGQGYTYTGGGDGVCRRNDSNLESSPDVSSVAQQPPTTREPSPEPPPTPSTQKPEDTKESTPTISPTLTSQVRKKCEEPIKGVKPGLNRWWATAGDKPISVTWTVEVDKEGEYSLQIIKFDSREASKWKLSGSNNSDPKVITASKAVKTLKFITKWVSVGQVNKYFAELGCLKPGKHTLTIDSFYIPNEPSVEEFKFELLKLEGSSPKPLNALFIADHPDTTAGKQYQVDIDGEITSLDVSGLVNHFAPVLHFHIKDYVQFPYDAGSTFSQSRFLSKDGDNQLRSGNSKSYLEFNISSIRKVYASVLENEVGQTKELAINYYFFYPISNWATYGGHNTHEGDWEGITLFLRLSNGKWVPHRVVYAQHTHGLEVSWRPNIFGSDKRPHVYVGLGGHASYEKSGITHVTVPRLSYKRDEYHNEVNPAFDSKGKVEYLPRAGKAMGETWDSTKSQAWLLYSGTWGNPDLDDDGRPDGDGAPRGPMFLDTTLEITSSPWYGSRWLHPWRWYK